MVVVTAEARESTVDCEKPLRMAMCGQAGPPELATVDGGSNLDHTGCALHDYSFIHDAVQRSTSVTKFKYVLDLVMRVIAVIIVIGST